MGRQGRGCTTGTEARREAGFTDRLGLLSMTGCFCEVPGTEQGLRAWAEVEVASGGLIKGALTQGLVPQCQPGPAE